jgi:hypothetical protein
LYVKNGRGLERAQRDTSVLFRNEPGLEDEKLELNGRNEKARRMKEAKSPSLGICLIKTVLGKFIGALALKICHDTLNFARPVLLELVKTVRVSNH